MAITWMKCYEPTICEKERIENTLDHIRSRVKLYWRLRRDYQRAASQARTEAAREMMEDTVSGYTHALEEHFLTRRILLGRRK